MNEDTVQEQVAAEGETPSEQNVISLPNFDEIGFQFTDEIVPLIQEYAKKLPIIHIVKILQNLTTDLVFQNASFMARKAAEDVKEHMDNRSKIITV